MILCDGFDIGVETSFHISVNKIAIADFVEKCDYITFCPKNDLK